MEKGKEFRNSHGSKARSLRWSSRGESLTSIKKLQSGILLAVGEKRSADPGKAWKERRKSGGVGKNSRLG